MNILEQVKAFKTDPAKTKGLIFWLFLAVSCYLVGSMGWNISDKLPNQIFGAVVFISLDLFAQFCLSLGKLYWTARKIQAWFFYLAFGVYILFFSIPSAVGFFQSELSGSIRVLEAQETSREMLAGKLTRLEGSIKNLNSFLSNEITSGYGWKAAELSKRIQKAEQEYTSTIKQYQSIPVTISVGKKDYFTVLSKTIGIISADGIKLILFAVACLFLNFALIVCNPSLERATLTKTAILRPIETAKNKKITQDKNTVFQVLDHLVRDNGKLNGNAYIVEQTGLPDKKVDEIKKAIADITVNGMPLIEIYQGGGKANFQTPYIKALIADSGIIKTDL